MPQRPMLTEKAVREFEQWSAAQREAVDLLEIIAAEFKSDPMSVQCFDARIVKRAIECAETTKRLQGPFGVRL